MDPNLATWLTRQSTRDGLQREYVTYRPPADRTLPRLTRASRRALSTLLLTLGQRLSDEPRPAAAAPEIDTIAPTS